MQGILITLATAVILAIGGAFAAPFVVDWGSWRSSFENEMGRALGLPVVIRGPIEAEILPTPRVVLRDVTLGDVVSTGGTVQRLEAELSLGALIRGEVHATGVTLRSPRMRLVLDSSGRVALPIGTGPAGATGINRLDVQDGSLDILDRASDRTFTLGAIDLKGEARSLAGPFRLDGELNAAGARYGLKSTLGKFGDDGSGKLKLTLDSRGNPFALDLDGALGFADRRPRFEGRGGLARKGGEGFDSWQFAGTLKASPEAIVAESLDLALGGIAIPPQLSGSARLSLARGGKLDAVLNARSLDLDALRAATPAAARPESVFGAIGELVAGVAALPSFDGPAQIGLSAEQLMVGGTLVKNARADLAAQSGAWRINTAEAQLPGRASVRLSGKPLKGADGDGFDGEVGFASDDPAAFLRWAAPEAISRDVAGLLRPPLRATARISATPARIAIDGLDATLAQSRLRGTLASTFALATGRSFDARLTLDGFDLDPLVATLRAAGPAAGRGAKAKLTLDGQNLTLAGLPVRRFGLDGEVADGNWRVSRLQFDDLAGLKLDGSGGVTDFVTTPSGAFTFTMAGTKADALPALARPVLGEAVADVLARLAPVAAPVRLSGNMAWNGSGERTVSFDGGLGTLSGQASFTRMAGADGTRVGLTLDAADASRALGALGLDGLQPRLGQGRLRLTLDPVGIDAAKVSAKLEAAGLSATADGSAALAAGILSPDLNVRLEAADLGRILPQVAAASSNAPVPAAVAFRLARRAPDWRLDDISGSLAGAPVRGRLEFEPGGTPRLGGSLAFDTLSLPRLLGLWGARAADGPDGPAAPWGTGRLAGPSISGVALALELAAERIAVLGPFGVTGGKLKLNSDGGDLEVRDISGAFGGGRAAGTLQVRRRGDAVQADGRLNLDKVDLAALLAPLNGKAPPQGRISLAADFGGSGRNVQALVQSLSGQGTLALDNLVVDAADPSALAAVVAEAAGLTPPPDERRTIPLLDRALAHGPLSVPQAETTFGIVNGTVRLSPTRANAAGGRAGFSGTLDLARLNMTAGIDIEAPDGTGATPSVNLSWRGPLAAPERRVGAATLTGLIAMRAIERETKRLEEQQAQDLVRQQTAQEQAAKDQAAREQAAREQAARDQVAKEQAAREQAVKDQAAREQQAREQATREQAARERVAREQQQREQAAKEQAARDQAARDQAAREQQAKEQAAREQVARERAAREQQQREQAAREQAAKDQAMRDQAAREAARASAAQQRPQPAPTGRVPAQGGIDRQDLPPPAFGAPSAPSGGTGTGTGAGTGTASVTPAPSAPAPAEIAPVARPEPPAANRRPPPQQPAQNGRPAERRPNEAQRQAPPPQPPLQLPQESNLPPTSGFGELHRPPGLIGQ